MFIIASASVPPSIAALAGKVISVMFGLSFVIIVIRLLSILFFTAFTIFSTNFGLVPKAIPPSLIFGHDTFISKPFIIYTQSSRI